MPTFGKTYAPGATRMPSSCRALNAPPPSHSVSAHGSRDRDGRRCWCLMKVSRALESLSLSLRDCNIDLGYLLPCCPRLRKLQIDSWQLDSLTVHSPSLEELDLSAPVLLRRIDISATVLKTLRLFVIHSFDNEFTLKFSAPLVDNLTWRYVCHSTSERFGVIWFMWSLTLLTPKSLGHVHGLPDNILWLNIGTRDNLGNVSRSFEQEISRIPVRNISCLVLQLATKGHVYGAMLLDLIGLYSSIQRLQVTINRYDKVKACSVNCPCHQPYNWRSQIISLTDLKEVSIEGFKGEEHEVGLLKVLPRCAVMLERVTINFPRNVPRSCTAYMELPSILKAHPSVKFKKGGPGAAVEPTVCNRKVPGSSHSLCTFVWVRLGA
ncbi:hypothetical protein PVAP13_9NG188100 [Panicum virgatum]|uniref:FBD domain-containing protein n=1 Tax=Panicum virgatum TaxID=38727 RepID=A0A8T0MM62_PANVG|nr:hypothetical protein PVAP13_9NG188100 [Panicum virgatum]